MQAQSDRTSVDADRRLRLLAGVGKAQIEFPAEIFPIEAFVGIHDPLHVRIVVLECGERMVLVSIEMTSLADEQVGMLRALVGEAVGASSDNVWVCVTHTMSAPHILPGHRLASERDRERNVLLTAALETAVRGAASLAAAGMQEARLGHGDGRCDINVNRDIPTIEGWWLGCSETGFSDKTVTVIRVEALDGHPLALLFSHSVRPAVMERSPGAQEAALITADLAGAASRFLEDEYGEGTVALFFMGAAGDQAPCLTGARFQYVGNDGRLRTKDMGDAGCAVAEMIGARLGAEVLRISESVECQVPTTPLVSKTSEISLDGQEMPDTRSVRPSRDYIYREGPARLEPLAVFTTGDVAVVGVRPELCSALGVDIRERSPFTRTLVLCMVNGGAKYMADVTGYDRNTYAAMNSPFARGSGECLAGEASLFLRGLLGEVDDGKRMS